MLFDVWSGDQANAAAESSNGHRHGEGFVCASLSRKANHELLGR